MNLNGTLIPKYVFIDLLSFLDSKSLRNCLMVNRKWYELGSSKSLDHLSGRGIVRKINKFNNSNFLQRIKYFSFGDLKKVLTLSAALKEKIFKKLRLSLFLFSVLFSFFPLCMMYLKCGGWISFFFFLVFQSIAYYVCYNTVISRSSYNLMIILNALQGFVEGIFLSQLSSKFPLNFLLSYIVYFSSFSTTIVRTVAVFNGLQDQSIKKKIKNCIKNNKKKKSKNRRKFQEFS